MEDPGIVEFLLTAIVILIAIVVADGMARMHDRIMRRWPRKPGRLLPRTTRGNRKW